MDGFKGFKYLTNQTRFDSFCSIHDNMMYVGNSLGLGFHQKNMQVRAHTDLSKQTKTAAGCFD